MPNQQTPKRSMLASLVTGGDVRATAGKYSDVGVAALVVVIVSMMIVPLPTFLLDGLISLNIAVSVTLLLLSIYVSDALKIATFPTLLLLTTLFRLALQVSATRMILLHANGGEVIAAFGKFVVAGNLVVGAVIFVIITVIQFVVISKGSERVAEVGARFTLDAMPGKQMSIDAELRAGHIDHAEARRRRAMLARESQFFGAMDGAMKFVKGDAIAGIIVLLTNVIGGLVIGVVQRGMEVGAAARVYTVLTIGEGLVAQIPALIVSTAAGILVTRVSSDEEGGHLGSDIARQVLAHPKALAVSAALLALLAVVPGMPTVPFLVLAVGLGFVAHRIMKAPALPLASDPSAAARASRAELISTAPVTVDLSPALTQALLSAGDAARISAELLPAAREGYFARTGLPMPPVRVRANAHGLAAAGYQIRINEVPVGRGEVLGGALVLEGVDRVSAVGLPGQSATQPDGTDATWIPDEVVAAAGRMQLPLLLPEEVIVSDVVETVRRHGHELVGIQEVQNLLDALERTHPALVREVVPKLASTVLVTDVIRRLAEEGVSVRNLRDVLGSLAQWAPIERDPVALTERVRAALRRQITFEHTAGAPALGVYLLDAMIEETVREAIQKTATGSYLALEPDLSRDILAAMGRTMPAGTNAVVLTAADIRRYVRRLIETEFPRVSVLSYQELMPEVRLTPLGRVQIG